MLLTCRGFKSVYPEVSCGLVNNETLVTTSMYMKMFLALSSLNVYINTYAILIL